MSIGTKIKELRRKNDVTQEELSEYLGISSKAVSQWERNVTAPDLSQIPLLCAYFSVTSDELLEIDLAKRDEERKRIRSKANKLKKNGYHREAWELLHDGLKKFPDDYEMMHSIVCSGTMIVCRGCNEEEAKKITEENILLCEKILDGCTDELIRQNAISSLCDYYADRGEIERAREMAYKMPIMFNCREYVINSIERGDSEIESAYNLRNTLLQIFVNHMAYNHKHDSGEFLYSAEEIVELRKKKISLLELVFEKGDFGFYNHALCSEHKMLAHYYMSKGNIKDALYHLECAKNSAIDYIEYMKADSFIYESLLFKGHKDQRNAMTSDSDNEASRLLGYIESPDFDKIRDLPEFTEIINDILPYSGKNDY